MRAVGLFAGIGGVELGLQRAGIECSLLCEVWEPAKAVLENRFADVPLIADVRDIDALPESELVVAGFPCQDLSQAGRTAGISGSNSGLVAEVFRLIDSRPPEWLVLENVPFMLQLDRGAAMRYLTDQLEARGYTWAYRVVDTRSFGLPQRRKRVVVVASALHDPRGVLFADDAGEPTIVDDGRVACGFYWTEGTRGLGWAVDAVPTLKGGSTIGIPSPPAVWLRSSGGIVLPNLLDAERLQGFPADWTAAADSVSRRNLRWKLVGNAVSVPVAEWLGRRLLTPGVCASLETEEVKGMWPSAAWGREGRAFRADVSHFPFAAPREHLEDFLVYPTKPLSERATAGFLSRASRSTLRFPADFLRGVAEHLDRVRERVAA